MTDEITYAFNTKMDESDLQGSDWKLEGEACCCSNRCPVYRASVDIRNRDRSVITDIDIYKIMLRCPIKRRCFIYIYRHAGLEFHGECVLVDSDLFNQTPDKLLKLVLADSSRLSASDGQEPEKTEILR